MKPTLLLVMDMINDIVAEDGFNAATFGVQVKQRNVLANTAQAIAKARAAGVTADEHMHAIACLGRYARILRSEDFDWRA